jgi:hypothetical protein
VPDDFDAIRERALARDATIEMPCTGFATAASGMFSATMAAMDGALNHNAGIFVRSFYQTVLCSLQIDQCGGIFAAGFGAAATWIGGTLLR